MDLFSSCPIVRSRRVHPGGHLILVAMVLAFLTGCAAAPTDVKQASTDIDLGLAELTKAQRTFRDRYIQEIRATQDLVVRAFVASAMVRTVESLSDLEASGDLLVLSQTLTSERDAHTKLAALVRAKRPKATAEAGDVVTSVLTDQAKNLEALAATLDPVDPATAETLRLRAAGLRGDDLPGFDHLVALVQLSQVERAVRDGMADLENTLQFLQLTHATLDDWIQTDVKVSGTEVAKLVQEHESLLTGSGDAP